MSVIVAEQTRGPIAENLYHGDAAVVDATGRLLFRVGDAQKVTYWRSSAKPIQAMPVVLSGAYQAYGFGLNHLAMFSASHNGEPVHTETVLDAMQKAGLTPDLLQCGPHAPYDQETADAMAAAGQAFGRIHNNCSGKHTGMLALAKHLGLPLENYLEPDSDLQQLILENVADVVGLAREQISIGVDGCGVPVFGLPLHNMAYSFARLSAPEFMPAGKSEAGRLFRDAMLAFPHNVAGRGRICTEIMELTGRRFVAKSGAEGVYCVGVLPEAAAQAPILRDIGAVGGIGIAVKAEDGHAAVRHLLVLGIMQQLGLLTPEDLAALDRFMNVPVKNWAGREVGELRPVFQLERA